MNLDLFVEDAEERAKAAKQLRDIAIKYPDMFRQICKCCAEPSSASDPSEPPRIARRTRMPPTQAVRQWLRDHADGGSRSEIVAGVIDRVRTESDDPRQVINAAITVLTRNGEIVAVARPGERNLYRFASNNGVAN